VRSGAGGLEGDSEREPGRKPENPTFRARGGVKCHAMPCQASRRPIGRCSTECDSKLGARSGDKVVPPQYWAIRVVTRDWKDEDE